jgi:hypothetical protein
MTPDLLPLSPSHGWRTAVKPRLCRAFLRSNGSLKIRLLSTAFTGLIVYLAFHPPHDPLRRLPNWQPLSHYDLDSLELAGPSFLPTPAPKSTILAPPLPSSPESDVLSPEQIRDIVAPTRGFFSRDYSLGLGWNNVSVYCGIRNWHRISAKDDILTVAVYHRGRTPSGRTAESHLSFTFVHLLARVRVRHVSGDVPSLHQRSYIFIFPAVYRAICADYTPMVNRGDALGSDEWRELPIEQQMGFRIPISVIVNVTHLRNRQPVITASEYLRLHGQDPENESSDGFWPRESYHTHANVFETNKTKTPSLFVIKNHWYEYGGTNRVNYIPEAMKRRGHLECIPSPEDFDIINYWPPLERTELSRSLSHAMPWDRSVMPGYC